MASAAVRSKTVVLLLLLLLMLYHGLLLLTSRVCGYDALCITELSAISSFQSRELVALL